MYQVAGVGVPDLAGSIVAASDKLVPIFVEAAVSEREDMRLQCFE